MKVIAISGKNKVQLASELSQRDAAYMRHDLIRSEDNTLGNAIKYRLKK